MQSDILSYQKNPRWLLDWYRNPQGVSLTQGSLSWFTLYSDTQMKFSHAVHDDLSFEAQYIEESDLENDFRTVVFAFEKRWGNLGAALNGAPQSNKADADIGLALSYYGDDWQLKAFQTFFDAPRNKHSTEEDYFSKTYPFQFGVALSQQQRLWHFGLRVLPPLTWNFPQYKTVVQSKEVLGQWESLVPVGDGDVLQLQVQVDVNEASKEDTETSKKDTDVSQKEAQTQHKDEMKRTRALLRVRWQHALANQDELLGGLEVASRRWNNVTATALIPHGSWQTKVTERWLARVGGDLSFYRDAAPWQIESRLNLAGEHVFSETTRLLMQATFDLDEPGLRRRFQGGNVQFLLLL